MAETTRARAERDVLPVLGARFFREDGAVLFQFVIDAANIIGPRPATKADSEKHTEAWSAFIALDQCPVTADAEPVAIEPEPTSEPVTVVAEKDMATFVKRLDPPPAEPRHKRKYTRRAVA